MSKIEAAIHRARMLHNQAQATWAAGSSTAMVNSSTAPVLAREAAGNHSLSVEMLRRAHMDPNAARENRVLGHDASAHGGQSEYRMLRTRLMQRMRSNNWQIVGVSAAAEGAGKTLTALNLAISIAAEVGQEAVLLELDLRRPSIYQLLGISPQDFTCVANYLQDESTEIRDLLVCPDIERLGCMLCSTPLMRASDLLASNRGRQLFNELRRQLLPQTVVVVDLPPLLSTDDALVVAPMIDALLFVVAEGQTRRSELVEANGLLAEFNVIGTVLNKSVETDPRTYY